jgi:pectate lyase
MKQIHVVRSLCAVLAVFSAGVLPAVASAAITAADASDGWASYTGLKDLAGNSVVPPDAQKGTTGGAGAAADHIYTVSDRSSFLAALKNAGGKPSVIYVNGMIDMTDGMLPADGMSSTAGLDALIAKVSADTVAAKKLSTEYSYTSYADWKKSYGAHVLSTQDQSGDIKTVQQALLHAWGDQIKIMVPSNCTIIGLTAASGTRGGTFQLSDGRNIILRNLVIQDAFDPFPEQEADDGLNAAWDTVQVKSCSYVWIDHCTFEDTVAIADEQFDHTVTADGKTEKWQTYDGLCDLKTASDFVTVSWCLFKNHDKTSLIGASKSATGDKDHLTITLHHNYYLNCRQRLPMVRYATIHIYNNMYDTDASTGRTNQYAVGDREYCRIVAENNTFGKGIGRSVDNSQGAFYGSGNEDLSKSGIPSAVPLKDKPFDPSSFYRYSLDSTKTAAKLVTSGAGAGKLTVTR